MPSVQRRNGPSALKKSPWRYRAAAVVVAVLALTGVLRRSMGADGGSAASTSSKPVDFNRDVRPILASHCFPCHGPDAAKRKGDPPLRLDVRDGLFGERDGSRPV